LPPQLIFRKIHFSFLRKKSRTWKFFAEPGIHFTVELRIQGTSVCLPNNFLITDRKPSEAAQCRRKTMKCLITFLGFAVLMAQAAAAADEQSLLARVTVYWRSEGSGESASSNGARLREGHCAVDPRKIPFGSRVVFDDTCCVAVDSGSAVLSRKAARLSGRNSRERNALVIDRFFETKRKAMAWAEAHPHFMTVWIIPPGSASLQKESQRPNGDQKVADVWPYSIASPQPNNTAAATTKEPTLRYIRRRG
jgi:3D (Asp-Asp-Asp) domain-containing protein